MEAIGHSIINSSCAIQVGPHIYICVIFIQASYANNYWSHSVASNFYLIQI